jgi:predicted amidohydrolase YtcJ
MTASKPRASALLIENGRIIAVDESPIGSSIGYTPDRVWDMSGRTILPGLCDTHIHIEQYAQLLTQVDCETETLDQCLKRVAKRCSELKPGQWVLGHGWNQNNWGRYGTLQELDSVSPHNPVYLTAKSLHAGWANSLALKSCEIGNATQDPPRGELQRDEMGQITGILLEDAVRLISQRLPKPSASELSIQLREAQSILHQFGLTAIHDFDSLRCLEALKLMEAEDALQLRILKQIRHKDFAKALEAKIHTGAISEWIRIGHHKLFTDGALGPRTAAMLSSYEGEPDNFGMLQLELEEIVSIGRESAEAGYPLSIHAIGDRATRTALDALEALSSKNSIPQLPFPHRIEHLQLIDPADLRRPSDLGIVVAMQPIHALSDYQMAEKYWGERIRYSYAPRIQMDNEALVIFGSDAPVESPNPWLGIHAAVTRKPEDARSAWNPEEKVSLQEALIAYTLSPAISTCWQDKIGQLTEGCYADLIVLDQDPFKIEPTNLKDLMPSSVMVNGEWIFTND